ncbi:ABC transporter ATP-binding protein [Aureitalea marina]|uniref:ABC transporter domain-containing protein n=1 Tax=Aureitalea marina TaxID=930804 RepID=A0A2S7KNI6_9FLAO|nr:ABC transporter ATP-binding protein [Aureitalea marina]PQB04194.1 hypothetical protein BST85_04210 [Aureitalea marina]
MIFQTDAISKSFGQRLVLDQVNFGCQAGEIKAVIGPNGAGKTTLFKLILGLLRPDSGKVHWKAETERSVGAIIEKPSFYSYLNASENIRLFGKLQGHRINSEKVTEILVRVGLDPDRKDPVRNYSMGMKQRLGIAIALLGDPEVLILDEPFSGLDPMGIRSLSDLLTDLAKEEDKAIVISSHFMDQLIKFCDQVSVMSKGSIIVEGSSYDLLSADPKTYRLEGPDLLSSDVLKELDLQVDKHRVNVRSDQMLMQDLLGKLLEEGTVITACIPLLAIEELMKPEQ